MNKSNKKFLPQTSKYIKLIFLFLDLIVLNFSFFIAFIILFRSINFGDFEYLNSLVVFANLIWILLMGVFNAYAIMRVESLEKILSRTIRMSISEIVIIFILVYSINLSSVPILFVLIFSVLFLFFNISIKVLSLLFLKSLRKNGFNNKNVVIVGVNKNGLELERILKREISFGYRVLGFFTIDKTDNLLSQRLIGYIDDFYEFALNNHIDEVYIANDNLSKENYKKLIGFCESNMIRIKLIPNFQEFTSKRHVKIDFYDNLPIIILRKEPLENVYNQSIKRLFDVLFSLSVLLLICSWVFPILAIIIRIDSKGKIFFSQKRWGKDGKEFNCFKFRSMYVNNLSDSLQASKNDSRITKIGKILRKTSLDELPQFFNVLKGDMSVVGPRPHMIKHNIEYSKIIDNYMVRQFTKPGITGWAQVNGYRGETKDNHEMESRVDYDIWYLENWNLLLDIKIIFLTVFNVFKGENKAY